MDWLEIAKHIPVGGKERVICCGSNRDAIISNNGESYRYHCFKCDTTDYHQIQELSLELIRKLDELNNQEELSATLPNDFSPVIPIQHRLWLYRAGIRQSEYMQAGIGWSDYLQRIVIPLYSDSGELLYYQCRAVHKGQLPKYKNPPICKSKLLYRAGNQTSKHRIIVTEDILSAIKVSQHLPAVSIMGTATSLEQASYLSEYRHVTYWLDPDEAGQKGNLKGMKRLSPVTYCDCIVSRADPKNLQHREIRQLLGLTRNERYIYHGPITPTGS